MQVSHKTTIFISGLIWFVVGFFLLYLGLHFILDRLHGIPATHFSLLDFVAHIIQQKTKTHALDQAAALLITFALFAGYFKGKFVLVKTAKKQIARTLTFAAPLPLKSIYPIKYYILIATMIGLGISMKYLPIAQDTRGFIDMTIGSALIQGALYYFRFAMTGLIKKA